VADVTPSAEKDVPEGLAHTCYCERLPYPHLSSTASGCPRVSPAPNEKDDGALARLLWSAYVRWEEGVDFGEHMVRAIRGSGWRVIPPASDQGADDE
jgi:hypothetical protein